MNAPAPEPAHPPATRLPAPHQRLSDRGETGLNSARLAARAAIFWERLWPALLPLLGVVALFLSISWLGLWPYFQETARWLALAVLALLALTALLPLRTVRWPSQAEADSRIEERSGLAHRPVTAQSDTLSGTAPDDPFAAALWREHRKRMAQRMDHLSAGLPQPAVAQRDPYGVRAGVVLVLFIAALAGYGRYGERIGDAFRNHSVAEAVAGARIDAWVTPPAYTNRPPVYLDLSSKSAITRPIPEGSVLVVRALGVEAPALLRDEEGRTRKIAAQDTDVPTFETIPQAGRRLTLRSGTQDIATFAFTIIPDDAPSIAFAETPRGSARGAVEFSFSVADDYGVASAKAQITPIKTKQEGAEPLVEAPQIALPLPSRRATDGKAKTSRDLTAHPWAGAEVTMRLQATDDADQTGESKPVPFALPERAFTDPLAKALIFERRRLAQDINARRSVAAMLNTITTTHPEEFIPDPTHYMALRVIYRMVSRNRAKEPLREALDLMWTTALAIEDGDLSAAESRLRKAQEALSQALENGAGEQEIDERMAELRAAMEAFMRELAEQAARQSAKQQAMQDPNARVMRKQDLDAMMQRIEDLAKSGSPDAARELLQQMQRMLNNLQTAQPQNGQPQNGQRQQNPMGEQMDRLGELMQRQQQLMDKTFDLQRRQQDATPQGQNPQKQPQQDGSQQNNSMTPQAFADAMRKLQQQQQDVQKQMQDLQQTMQQTMRDMGMDPANGLEDSLAEAGEAMQGAAGQLGKGKAGKATGEQGRALQAMRDGARHLMQQMMEQARANGQMNGATGPGQNRPGGRNQRDPLGRQSNQSNQAGPQFGDDVKVPGEIDARRAREILNSIRRKLGETTRPKPELDYLDRLLPAR